ncbi:hypothetical protein GH5_04249 [Leishmania sp. Ghana 2012 LV757]|uniref:hypothetical protein n=1 Tax=Leishmania sp. Ghana 2012 LV757 TaxID=2803181 RepID=UPI001B626958|nr:hypothetical protein GH5_04249 [Leishmania sp. Ghana 2012 LV757]
MAIDSVASLTHRLLSLEDIIRQQEQTISAVLQRLRDVEQYAAAESRNREQAQQQLCAHLENRGGSTAEAVNRMQAILQSHTDHISALQADVQGQGAALRGVNDKHDAAFRGMEQRLQADVSGAHQRALSGETASAEAMRALQAQLQSMANAMQTIEARSHDDIVALQQQMSDEIAAQRQRSDSLESAMRDALRNVHGSLSEDVRSAGAQQRSDLEGAVQRINQGLEVLDQRTRVDMNQLHGAEQTDVGDLRRRISELESSVREVIQVATNGLASEMARVVQHSQMQDKRQATAHQAILQELAKHDSQIETVDLNWRGSVTDLRAKIGEDVAATQQRSVAMDQALQSEISTVQDRCVTVTDTLRRDLAALTDAVQENCAKPLQEVHRALLVQEQRLNRVSDDWASMQDYLKTFAAHVDEDVVHLKQVMEAAVRAAHSDLLERINLTSASVTMHPYPEMFRGEVNRGLAKLWEDAKSVFLTQRSFNGIQAQLAALESAVRVELCALAERNNDVWRSLDELRIAHLRAAQQPMTAATATRAAAEQHACRQSAAASTSTSAMTTPATSSPSRTPQIQDPAVETDAPKTVARPGMTATATATTGPRSSISGKESRTSSDAAKVEEIDRDNDDQNECLRGQQEEDIKGMRGSLQRLRISQAQEFSRYASGSHPGDTSITNAATVTATRIEDAPREADSGGRVAVAGAVTPELAQEDSVRVANAVPLALQRVDALEEAHEMQLKQQQAIRAVAAPAQQDEMAQQPRSPQQEESSKASTALFRAKVSRSLSASLPALAAREADGKVSVSDAVAPITLSTPGQPTIRNSLSAETLATSEDDLVEVPGSSTGEVFVSRQGRAGHASSASVRMRPATTGTNTISTKFVTSLAAAVKPISAETVVPQPSPSRGSCLPELLLPTHQFVRKREYNSFKGFTKREIDTIWVEVMNMRRTRGLSKEELLLYMGQSKEQMLSTVLKVVQQQEEEMLGLLASIKTQLAEIQRSPDLMREIRVFPIADGEHLEEFVRTLSSSLKATPGAVMPVPPSTPTVAAESLQGRAQKALSRPAIHGPASPRADASNKSIKTAPGQLVPPTPRGNHSGVDSTLSSSCSSLPIQPQLILPVVRRGASPPRLMPQPEEVLCIGIGEMGSPKLGSSPMRGTLHCLAPKPTSVEGQPNSRRYTKDAFVHPKAAIAAPRLIELECLSSKVHPADMSSTSVPSQQDKSSPSMSILTSVARPPSLGSFSPAARGPEGGGDSCRYASLHADRTAPPQGLGQSSSESSVCVGGGDEAKRCLQDATSPRNPTGSSFHLNPLHEIDDNDAPPPTEAGVRLTTSSTAVSSVMVAGSKDGGRQLLEDDSRPSGTGPRQYSLRGSPLSREAAHAKESVVIRLADTAVDKHPSVNMSQGSEIYWQSVENMRPSRSSVRRRFAGTAEAVPARHDASPSFVRELSHLYKLQTPVLEQLYAPSLQFLSPTGKPQQRDHRTARDGGDNLVPIGTNPQSDIIRLGPYVRPAGGDIGGRAIALRPPVSLHAISTPNVNSSGVRNRNVSARDVQSTSGSLGSPNADRHCPSATSSSSNVVAVRVLDSPVSRADDSSREGHSLGIGTRQYRSR